MSVPNYQQIIASHREQFSDVSEKIRPADQPAINEQASDNDQTLREIELGMHAMTQKTQDGLNNTIKGPLADFQTHQTEFKAVLDKMTEAFSKMKFGGLGGEGNPASLPNMNGNGSAIGKE